MPTPRLFLRTPAARLPALPPVALLLAGCTGLAADSVVLARDPALAADGPLAYLGGLELRMDDDRFGGLSDLALEPDGSRFVAIIDKGAVATGRLLYDAGGRLTGAEGLAVRPMPDADGRPAVGTRRDAEGLVRDGDGWLVSFERDHRLMAFRGGPGGPAGAPHPVDIPAGWRSLPDNEGVEALAALPDGRLLALAEDPGAGAGTHAGWIGGPGQWRALRYRTEDPFRPVSAAALPGGDVLVLERRFSVLGGFASRLVRVAAPALAGDEIAGTELARLEPPGITENFEGLAVRPASDGGVLVVILSDDNFFSFQRTLLLQFRCDACGRYPDPSRPPSRQAGQGPSASAR